MLRGAEAAEDGAGLIVAAAHAPRAPLPRDHFLGLQADEMSRPPHYSPKGLVGFPQNTCSSSDYTSFTGCTCFVNTPAWRFWRRR